MRTKDPKKVKVDHQEHESAKEELLSGEPQKDHQSHDH